MAFARIITAGSVVLAVFILWNMVEHRAQRRTEPLGLVVRRSLRVLAVEAGLLTLLAGLWFASLGSGGGWLVFLLVALLVELPAWLRAGTETASSRSWTALAGRVARMVVAGMAGAVILAW